MQIKKVLAGSLAALTAGATLAMGAFAIDTLGDYVTTSDGTLTSPIVVIGAPAAPSSEFAKDVLGAADIAAAVAGFATTTVTSTGATTSVSNGADVATADSKLYFMSQMNKAKSTLTSNDLPSILATGTASVDLAGTFTYNQYINLGARVTDFGTSGGDIEDPELYIATTTSAAQTPLYNTTITFNKPLNVSHADVQGGTVTFAGVDYTIGSDSGATNVGYNPIVLFGGSNSNTITEGTDVEVTVGSTSYTVGVLGVSSATAGVVTVNGVSKSVAKGTSYLIEGLEVYIKDIFYLAKESQVSSMKVLVGSSKITLKNANKVKTGTEDLSIDGTLVSLTGDANGISKITIGIAGEDSSSDYILAGSSMVDPVFGTFKVALGGLTPALDDASRETITIDNSANTAATLKFTDYRGNEKQITWAQSGTGSSYGPWLNQSSTRDYVVIENQTVLENDYVLIAPSQESEFGHIYQLSDIDDIGGDNPAFTLTDVMSDDSVTVYLDTAGYKEFFIDGQAYCAVNTSATSMIFSWGGTSCGINGNAGSLITAFPLIKTKNGGYITLLDNRTGFSFDTVYALPGNNTVQVTSLEGVSDNSIETAGQISYGFYNGTTATSYLQNVTKSDGTAMVTTFPAVMFMQEKDNSTTKDFVTTDLTPSATNLYISVDTPVLSGLSDSKTLGTDTSITKYINVYGTQVETDSDNQGIVTIMYPDSQAVATIGVGTNPTFSTAGGTTTETAVKITAPVSKLASEVSSTAPGADLILVGGPCANTLAAAVLDADEQCDTWSYAEGIIKEVTDAFTDGSKALVIAGTTADNTRALAAKVMAGTLSYSA